MIEKAQISSFSVVEVENYARKIHEGQVTKGGEPYFNHLKRVAEDAVRRALEMPEGMFTFAQIVEIYCLGLLHDSLEDTASTEVERELRRTEIRALGASDAFIILLDALSRVDPKPIYMEWIRDMGQNAAIQVLIVKLADNGDNSSPDRIAQLPEAERSILSRYQRAAKILRAALAERVAAFTQRHASP